MQRRRTTKELIADSFLELSEKKNIDKITIKDITSNCELTPTTFYNHFQDKYDLIVWIYSTFVEKIMNKIGNNGYDWKHTLIDGVKYAVDNKKFLINAITHTNGQNSFINNMTRINVKVFLDVIKRNNNFDEIPKNLEILSKIYIYGSVCMLCEWLINRDSVDFEEFIKILEDSLPETLRRYLYKNTKM
ncbi:MAG: TetR/AcrR family transcriptional regulator C-terminal domain-containing protein [Selenomonadaceae bacterium]|nr:TetR/AcrR family transcriptional regulator C-terminal domain-containing protein [Selenomonadaceae bacterium]